jgi:hypothetical protein
MGCKVARPPAAPASIPVRARLALLAPLLGLLCSTTFAGPQPARPDLGPAFERYESLHFHLWTDLGASTGRFYLDQFESTFDSFYSSAGKAGLDPAPPRRPLVAIIFAQPAGLRAYLKATETEHPAWSAGHFSWRTGIVALCHETDRIDPANPAHAAIALRITLNKARHEIAHQLLDASGILPAAQPAPEWLAEGLATLFEEGGPEKPNPQRLRTLELAAEAGRPLDLRQLLAHTTADDEPAERIAEFYAGAWALLQHLWISQPAALGRYLKEFRSDPSADQMNLFQKHFGQDLDQLQRRIEARLRRGA